MKIKEASFCFLIFLTPFFALGGTQKPRQNFRSTLFFIILNMESDIIVLSDNSRPVDFGSDDLVAAVNFSSDDNKDPSDPQVVDISSEREVNINSDSDIFEFVESGGSGLINEDDEIFFRSGEDHPAEDLLNRLEFDESTQAYTDDVVMQSLAALSAIKAAKYSFSEIEGKYIILGKIGEGE